MSVLIIESDNNTNRVLKQNHILYYIFYSLYIYRAVSCVTNVVFSKLVSNRIRYIIVVIMTMKSFYLDTKKKLKISNIVHICIMLIMLVIDIGLLVCPGDLISVL